MHPNLFTRRDFSVKLATIVSGLSAASAAFASNANPQGQNPAASGEITHTCEAIHQEVIFKATRKRVYEALTDTKQFDKVVQLSDAMKSGMAPNAKPTEISREAGGAFSAFGGYVSGRQIDLLPDEHIVQAWRAGSWKPGAYSIARFELTEQEGNTKLIFDHRGFPDGTAQHLAEGWHVNYWQPLAKFLAQQ
jgi:uncharacterized protein YndB with AHSA1/START domain